MDITKSFAYILARCGVKYFVCDFDQTITKHHTGGKIGACAHETELKDNIHNLDFLQRLFTEFEKKGIYVCIASFADEKHTHCVYSSDGLKYTQLGGETMIRRFLDIGFGTHRKFLQEDCCFECWIPGKMSFHKNQHLKNIFQKHNDKIQLSESMIFVDDCFQNVKIANETKTCNAFHVDRTQGINEKLLSTIVQCYIKKHLLTPPLSQAQLTNATRLRLTRSLDCCKIKA